MAVPDSDSSSALKTEMIESLLDHLIGTYEQRWRLSGQRLTPLLRH
jgi:hypothetical protein